MVASLNVDSNKTQKPCATKSPDLPDPPKAAVPVRTTRGRASKRDATGQFMCIEIRDLFRGWEAQGFPTPEVDFPCTSLICNVHVESDKIQPGATKSPDLPDPRKAAVPVRTRASKRDATGQFVCSDVLYMYILYDVQWWHHSM